MRDLNFQLKTLCYRHKEDSFRTRSDRGKQLQLIANQLHELGFRQMQITSLKEKHVVALVEHWQQHDLSDGSIKNRMANLRWWADKIQKPVIANDNSHYGIGRRQYVTNTDKSVEVSAHQLSKISNDYVRASLMLQDAFGLRREEAIKFSPSYADKGAYLQLKGSWTKGGKPRVVPIQTQHQRDVLKHVRELVGGGALIPANKNFIQQLRVYERQTANAGLSKLHGLRHGYAQRRYEELTGRPSPAAGGEIKSALTAQEKAADHAARLLVSKELGHEREQITAVYLGR
jgi:integrase